MNPDDIETLKKLGALASANPKIAGLLALVAIVGLAAGAVSGVLDPKKPRSPRPEAAVNILAIVGNAARGLGPWVVQFVTGKRAGEAPAQEEPASSDRETEPTLSDGSTLPEPTVADTGASSDPFPPSGRGDGSGRRA